MNEVLILFCMMICLFLISLINFYNINLIYKHLNILRLDIKLLSNYIIQLQKSLIKLKLKLKLK